MSEKLYSTEHKFLYIGVPKAATRSILSVLRRNEFTTSEFNEPISYHLEENPSHNDFFIFSFVRIPGPGSFPLGGTRLQIPMKKPHE